MDLEEEALKYHSDGPPGKIFTGLSKPLETQHDLSLAYSPGVAGPCRAIARDESLSYKYTGRGNLVGVITNGTAVLGLGAIGPSAAKPVMEGKAALFKKFADIDVFDIELNATDPEAFIAAVQALEPTFGGINLEDIKAPECFVIEERLRASMSIPVFHDDQHGTAIIAGAALLNALEVTGRDIAQTKIVFSGAGAAALACAALQIELGVNPNNILICDKEGVVTKSRKDLDKYKAKFARDTKHRTLAEALYGADVFMGLSAANVLDESMIKAMAANPIIFAMANPDPEIHPDVARRARPDAIIATGRSDYPNQVNNVLGFPFIFRGALDTQASTINEAMKIAAVRAIAALAKEDVPEEVMRVYQKSDGMQFGRDYLIPKPVDPRVLLRVAPAVAKAAMESGVARRQIDLEAYVEQLEKILGPTRSLLRGARKELTRSLQREKKPVRIVIPNGYSPKLLRAATQVVEDGTVQVVFLGDETKARALAVSHGIHGLDRLVDFVDPLTDKRAGEYAEELFRLRSRRGVSRSTAAQMIRNDNYFGAMMVRRGDADGMVSGLVEPYSQSVRPILEVIGTDEQRPLAGMYLIIHRERMYVFADCTIAVDPTADQLAAIAIEAANVAARYIRETPRVAMLSFESFGVSRDPLSRKVATAVEIVRAKAPKLIIDGEMQADVALNASLQREEFPFCALGGHTANVLIFPTLAAANISYKLVTNISSASAIGPLLIGVRKPANVLQRSAGTSEIASMIYLTAHQVVMAQEEVRPKTDLRSRRLYA